MITGNAVQKYKQGGILNSASVTELYGRLDIGTDALLVNRTPHYIIKGTSSHYFRQIVAKFLHFNDTTAMNVSKNCR